MYVEVRWIILGVVVIGVVVTAIVWPHLIPALGLGATVCGLLYLLLRLEDRAGLVRHPSCPRAVERPTQREDH